MITESRHLSFSLHEGHSHRYCAERQKRWSNVTVSALSGHRSIDNKAYDPKEGQSEKVSRMSRGMQGWVQIIIDIVGSQANLSRRSLSLLRPHLHSRSGLQLYRASNSTFKPNSSLATEVLKLLGLIVVDSFLLPETESTHLHQVLGKWRRTVPNKGCHHLRALDVLCMVIDLLRSHPIRRYGYLESQTRDQSKAGWL